MANMGLGGALFLSRGVSRSMGDTRRARMAALALPLPLKGFAQFAFLRGFGREGVPFFSPIEK